MMMIPSILVKQQSQSRSQLPSPRIVYQSPLWLSLNDNHHYNDNDNDNDNKDNHWKQEMALILLNSPIHSSSSYASSSPGPNVVLETLWKSCTYKICADGGANRLYQATATTTTTTAKSTSTSTSTSSNNPSQGWIPDMICGDLDSLESHVQEYYQSHHVQIMKDPCQDTNDLDKCMKQITSHWENNNSIRTIVIYGAFGGRVDQELASFHALYKWSLQLKEQRYRIWLYNDENCATYIPPHQTIELQFQLPPPATAASFSRIVCFQEGPTCGLIPLGCKCDQIVTTGLKWNLDGTIPLEFGGILFSSSNCIIAKKKSTTTQKHEMTKNDNQNVQNDSANDHDDDDDDVVEDDKLTIRASHAILFTTEIITTTSTANSEME